MTLPDDDIMRCPYCGGDRAGPDPEDRCVCDPEREDFPDDPPRPAP